MIPYYQLITLSIFFSYTIKKDTNLFSVLVLGTDKYHLLHTHYFSVPRLGRFYISSLIKTFAM